MRLIIGPTSAGKSSYIQGLTDEGAAQPKVYFAHQVQKSGNIPTGLDDSLPTLGVSARAEDLTFVFTPAGLERYFLDTVRVFTKDQVVQSPKPNRWLSIFSGKDKSVEAPPTVAILKKRIRRKGARIAELEQRLAEIEGSRSWKVTAPIRKVTGKVRPS